MKKKVNLLLLLLLLLPLLRPLSAICRWPERATDVTLVRHVPIPEHQMSPESWTELLYPPSTCPRWEGCSAPPPFRVWSPPWRWEVWQSHISGTCSGPWPSWRPSPPGCQDHWEVNRKQKKTGWCYLRISSQRNTFFKCLSARRLEKS